MSSKETIENAPWIVARNTIWHSASGKWIYERFGLSPTTIFFRWIQISTIVTLIVANASLIIANNFQTKLRLDSTYLLGIIGMLWAIYHAFTSEFASKYLHLLSIHDKLPTNDFIPCRNRTEKDLFVISGDLLNFGEGCVLYNLQAHSDFKFTFDELVCYLIELQVYHKDIFIEIQKAYPKLSAYIDKPKVRATHKKIVDMKQHRKKWQEWQNSVERRSNDRLRSLVSDIQRDLSEIKKDYPRLTKEIDPIYAKVSHINIVA